MAEEKKEEEVDLMRIDSEDPRIEKEAPRTIDDPYIRLNSTAKILLNKQNKKNNWEREEFNPKTYEPYKQRKFKNNFDTGAANSMRYTQAFNLKDIKQPKNTEITDNILGRFNKIFDYEPSNYIKLEESEYIHPLRYKEKANEYYISDLEGQTLQDLSIKQMKVDADADDLPRDAARRRFIEELDIGEIALIFDESGVTHTPEELASIGRPIRKEMKAKKMKADKRKAGEIKIDKPITEKPKAVSYTLETGPITEPHRKTELEYQEEITRQNQPEVIDRSKIEDTKKLEQDQRDAATKKEIDDRKIKEHQEQFEREQGPGIKAKEKELEISQQLKREERDKKIQEEKDLSEANKAAAIDEPEPPATSLSINIDEATQTPPEKVDSNRMIQPVPKEKIVIAINGLTQTGISDLTENIINILESTSHINVKELEDKLSIGLERFRIKNILPVLYLKYGKNIGSASTIKTILAHLKQFSSSKSSSKTI